jgi:outer membrane protein insertion porin family
MSGNSLLKNGARRVFLPAFLSVLLLAGLTPARASEGAPIDSLQYIGLSHVEPGLLEDALRVKSGEPADPHRLSETIRGLYALGLFDQIEAELERQEGRLVLSLRFAERAQISQIVFEGNDFFGAEELREHVPFDPGRVLNRADLFNARLEIEKAYRDEGFAGARVVPQAGPSSDGSGVDVRFLIEEGERPKVRSIHFEGNSAFLSEVLRGEVKIHTSGFLRKGHFTREKLEEDAERLTLFYRNHGFKEARAEVGELRFTPDGAGVEVVFRISEGRQYRFGDVSWEGVTVLDAAFLLQATTFRAGEEYAQDKLDDTIALVGSMYTERGYFVDLRIDPETQVVGDSVRVIFHVTEGPPSRAGDLRIVGNTRTREYVIRRELSIRPGDLLRRSALLRSQRDVFATGYFEDVGVEFEPGDESGEVDLTFRVKEKSSATATAGAGYSSQAGLTGFVQFGHNNLLGRGQKISVKLERGNRREVYDISFTEPWLGGRPISTGFDLYKTQALREVYSPGASDPTYWQHMWGGGLRVGFPWFLAFPDYTRMTLGYSFSKTTYDDYGGLGDETQTLLVEGEGRISRMFVSLYRNSTDNPFHPTLGTRTVWRTEFNGGVLGGDMQYFRSTVDHRQYFVPFWKPVFMMRWRGGVMANYRSGGRMPPAELFRLGGTLGFEMLRGYDDYYVVPDENITVNNYGNEVRFPGGRVMFGFTGEIQFPIVDPLHGVLFLDAGNTWNSGYDLSLNGLKYGLGAGVTLEIPMLGPVGFYYGYGTETGRWKTHFAFGTQL